MLAVMKPHTVVAVVLQEMEVADIPLQDRLGSEEIAAADIGFVVGIEAEEDILVVHYTVAGKLELLASKVLVCKRCSSCPVVVELHMWLGEEEMGSHSILGLANMCQVSVKSTYKLSRTARCC